MRTVILACVFVFCVDLHAHEVFLVINADATAIHLDQRLSEVPSKVRGGKTFHIHAAKIVDGVHEYALDRYGDWKVSPDAHDAHY